MAAAPAFETIGKPVPRVEGPAKVSGQALYPADVTLPGTLWAANVRSPLPHARIVSIDVAPALAVPGVRIALTAKDILNKRTGRVLKDLPLLCEDVARCVGDKVAVVAAETPEAAEEGALAVRVEYEELPAVFDPIEAMRPGAPLVHPDARSYAGFPHVPDLPNICGYRTNARGDVEAAMASADLVVEHTFSTPLTHQGYLEPHACVVRVGPFEGGPERAEVWPSHKLPYTLREQLADLTERPERDFVIHPITVGADFGAKGAPADVPVAYHLSLRTGRPVKFIASSQADLTGLSHRHPSIIWIKTGLKRDGTIVARDVRIVYNTGAYGSLKPSEDGMLTGADYAGGPYAIPNLRIEAFCVYTNLPPSGYMRAPGHPQVAFAVEAHTDLVAREAGIDPLAFRLKNAAHELADGTPSTVPTVLQAAADAIRSARGEPGRRQAQAERPAPSASSIKGQETRLVGRGMALAERGTGFGEGSSDITVNADGSVTVVTGLPDNGTGALTVVAQVVAEELGVPLERVHLVRGSTDALPVDVGSAADRMTNVAGHAAIATATKVKEQLTPLAATMLGTDQAIWTRAADGRSGWTASDGRFVSLEDLAMEMLSGDEPAAHAQVTINRPRSPARGSCVQIAEVEVDSETGQVILRKMTTVQDTGTIINPIGHQGQIDGGLVQGIGYALMEEMLLEDGRVANAHLGEYKLPTMRDVPELVTINVPSEGPGPFKAGSIGEMPCVPTAGAIANAVADAVGAPIFEIPITAERVLAALDAKRGRA